MMAFESSEPESFIDTSSKGAVRRSCAVILCALVFPLTGCEPDCDRLDGLFAAGIGRPESAPPGVAIAWRGGEGGVSVRSDVPDPEVFDPLLDHLFSGTSTTPGMVRWALVIGVDRVLAVEHPAPLELGARFSVDTLLDDLEFTGGRDSQTWWDTDWRWTAGSTTAARAVLTEAFESVLTTTSVRGEIEVRQTAPVDLRVGLEFENLRGATEAYWSDVEFDAAFGFEPCP